MRLLGADLACVRGGRRVFSGLGFAVAAGEALEVSGPNGAGKSSLLRLVAGLVRPASGRLELAGGDDELTIGEQAHYLGHQDALKPSLSVAENLVFWTHYLATTQAPKAGPNRPASASETLARVGLDGIANLPAAYLSAGQRRRLSIARLLAVARPIWLLDEPTAGLDVAAQAILAALMAAHLAAGGIILAAVHGGIGLARAHALALGGELPGSRR
jgi:heme exporter protein A